MVHANNVPLEFKIVDFPLMNMNDLFSTALLTGDLKWTDIPDKTNYVLGYGISRPF